MKIQKELGNFIHSILVTKKPSEPQKTYKTISSSLALLKCVRT